MACVILGFRVFGRVSFLGSPNLLLGPVLSANPAGVTCPVRGYSSVWPGLFLSCSTMNCTSISIRGDALLMSTGLTQPTLPHDTM